MKKVATKTVLKHFKTNTSSKNNGEKKLNTDKFFFPSHRTTQNFLLIVAQKMHQKMCPTKIGKKAINVKKKKRKRLKTVNVFYFE